MSALRIVVLSLHNDGRLTRKVYKYSLKENLNKSVFSVSLPRTIFNQKVLKSMCVT